jgi:hypothetical protein
LLAAIGIYGVLAQSVVQRTHEIGIRMAVGAQMRDVLKLILGHGMTLVALGIVTGIAGALGVTRLMTNLLFGVNAADPLTFVRNFSTAGVCRLARLLPARTTRRETRPDDRARAALTFLSLSTHDRTQTRRTFLPAGERPVLLRPPRHQPEDQRRRFRLDHGPSGAGKSSLLHVLGMHDHAWSGEYFFETKPSTA